jgi:hypothetical protein
MHIPEINRMCRKWPTFSSTTIYLPHTLPPDTQTLVLSWCLIKIVFKQAIMLF